MKACIVVGTYYSPGQTFVNRHIDKLFEGNTCVIADKLNDLRETDGRFLQKDHAPRGLGETLLAPFTRANSQLRYGSSKVPYLSARRRILDFLERQNPDVILSEFGPQGVTFAPVAQAAGIPMFCYFRGSDASSRIRHKHVQRAYQTMMGQVAGIFGVSQFLIDNLASVGATHDTAVVIPSGVDVRRFRPGEKVAGAAMAVGRFVEKKAPLLTIRAFAQTVAVVPEAHLTMIGDGELLEPARDLVRELGLGAHVSLPGALPHDEVRRHLERSELFLQHSVTARNGNTEGLPTAIQEAMAAGCITVTTRHAGIPEALDHGETGFMVAEYDDAGFAREMRAAALLPPAQKAQMSARARAVAVERFDNDVLLARLEECLRKAVR